MSIQYTTSQYKKANNPKLSQICNYGICSKGPKKEFEPAVVKEPSVFEPLKFYCIMNRLRLNNQAFPVIYKTARQVHLKSFWIVHNVSIRNMHVNKVYVTSLS